MNPVVKYFTGERLESFLFLSLGILVLAIAILFLFILKTSFLKGVAIPFLLVSFLEIIVGLTLIFRSPKDIIRVETVLSVREAKKHKSFKYFKLFLNFNGSRKCSYYPIF